MADLLALKKVRSTIKGSLTRMENFISANADKSNVDTDELKVRVETVHGLRTQFIEVEGKMFVIDSEADSQMDEFESKYYAVTGKLNRWIRKMNEAEHGTERLDEPTINNMHSLGAEIKLKKLAIPSFSGEYTEWPSFYDLYNSSIHSKDYPAVQKFQYLKSLVTGEAAQLIRYFTVTEANYYEAFSKLIERYDRKKYIINAFIRNFMDQPGINQLSVSSIRKLRDTSDEILRGLKALDAKAETRDCWLVYILLKKLDNETRMLWAQHSTESEYPTIKEFLEFLNKRCDALESMSSYMKPKNTSARALVTETVDQPKKTTWKCPVCKDESHWLHECSQFMKMPLTSRKGILTADRRCFNCFHKGHNVYNCRSKTKCKVCQRRHHTLLHESYIANQTSVKPHATKELDSEPMPGTSGIRESEAKCHQTNMIDTIDAILPTAIIRIKDVNGKFKLCRALLDSASQVTFITNPCIQRLGLITTNGRVMVSGLGQSNLGRTRGIAQLEVLPRSKVKPILRVQAYVIPKITTLEPASKINNDELQKLKSIDLADPNFHKDGHIDVLLGVEVFFAVMQTGQMQISPRLNAHETQFGWVVGGHISEENTMNEVVNLNVTVDIDHTLRKFWEIEDIPSIKSFTEEETRCTEWFEETTRKENGRFLVKLPVKEDFNKLGSNYNIAEQRLKAMENKFRRHPDFKRRYHDFMNEYEQLGHMKQLHGEINKNDYFLPHHGVIKETSTTTKLRVVFDASSKGINGISLNDLLMIGPTIQSSLLEILIRFRGYRYVISGDVEKMYRQVWVNQDDAQFQRILWRTNPDEPIKQYQLNTLTYGTSPASFIATRCIIQAAREQQLRYPEAATAIENDMYVDDLMTGANSESELNQLKEDILNILEPTGFKLRKWATNSQVIRNKLEEETSNREKNIAEDETIKLLGIKWNPSSDSFCFAVHISDRMNHNKRTLLSEASKIFDPLGWLSPLTIRIKILFQSLWLRAIMWDDILPADVQNRWLELRKELKEAEKLNIPRWLQCSDEVELHGFSDASELAYSAVVYVKNTGPSISVHMVAGKTRVAPIRQLSLPRLELLGAVLLTELITTIQTSWPEVKIQRTILWSDSKIVLDWLGSHPRRWNTFVANRVSLIIDKFPRECWRHVPSKENAADCASRGIPVAELLKPNCIWWKGPDWLYLTEEWWPKQKSSYHSEVELKSKHIDVLMVTSNSFLNDFIKRYNSFEKMKRILATIVRYICKVRSRSLLRRDADCSEICVPNTQKTTNLDPVNLKELQNAEVTIIRYVQKINYGAELKCLQNNQVLPSKSPLKALNAFLDDDGIIRVGGRISNSMANYNTKHPIILPYSEAVSKGIVLDLHLKWLHAGSGLLVSLVRQKYWIIRVKDIARLVVHKCIKCIRYKPKLEHQLMGDLPDKRVNYAHPFINVGIDYCGPFRIHQIRRRGLVPTKMYVCIFVCLATKAVHIEVAGDMSTKCFLGVLKRFIARRGICHNIYSDNGSNFIGANNKLKEWYTCLKKADSIIRDDLIKNEIQWHFNPPLSPHMGGLWEAAVKAMKSHLKKVVGETILAYEELHTLLCQIEAIMNSRPICAAVADEPDVLTPGHFLIGRRMTEIIEPVAEVKLSPVARWEMVTKLKQHFEMRWKRDYLTSLQRRDRWQNKSSNLKLGELVLISDESPATSWSIGRITELHPGVDGSVRVVTIKTTKSTLKRSIHKLCRLPIYDVESGDSRPAR